MKNRTSTFSSYLLSISKFVMIDWFTKSQHSLSSSMCKMMADGTGRNTQDILKDIVRVLTTSNSLEEAQVSDMSNITSQINPSSSSVVTQAVARLFRGTFTRTTTASTSRPAKSKKRQYDSTSRRDSGFFLKDVMLLPSTRIKKIPCGKLRESLHIEGYAASVAIGQRGNFPVPLRLYSRIN